MNPTPSECELLPQGLTDDEAVDELLDLSAAVDLADRMRDQGQGGDTVADRGSSAANET